MTTRVKTTVKYRVPILYYRYNMNLHGGGADNGTFTYCIGCDTQEKAQYIHDLLRAALELDDTSELLDEYTGEIGYIKRVYPVEEVTTSSRILE